MNLGQANREVCNVSIRDFKTGEPYMYYEYANTTGLNVSSDSVYAMAHGARKIAFSNPLEGEVTITAQVLPFKMYALYSDGIIDTSATYFVHKTITAAAAGALTLGVTGGTVVAGTVFAYPKGEYGNAASAIKGTFADGTFTATTASEIAKDSEYEVGFMLSKENGVQKVTLNNKRLPKDVTIEMDTFMKDEEGNFVPFHVIVHKASLGRTLDVSFSSEGDPQEVTLTFTALEKDRDHFVDLIEITEDE